MDKAGNLIGAVGVSGDTVKNDYIVAVDGAARCGECDMPKHPWRT